MASIVYTILYWTAIKYQIQYTKLGMYISKCKRAAEKKALRVHVKEKKEIRWRNIHYTHTQHIAQWVNRKEIMKQHTNKQQQQ